MTEKKTSETKKANSTKVNLATKGANSKKKNPIPLFDSTFPPGFWFHPSTIHPSTIPRVHRIKRFPPASIDGWDHLKDVETALRSAHFCWGLGGLFVLFFGFNRFSSLFLFPCCWLFFLVVFLFLFFWGVPGCWLFLWGVQVQVLFLSRVL